MLRIVTGFRKLFNLRVLIIVREGTVLPVPSCTVGNMQVQ